MLCSKAKVKKPAIKNQKMNKSKTKKNKYLTQVKWNQWLAGIIDGDGYLAIQKSNNVAVCEITMPLQDEALLFQIKQKLGGNIKQRVGSRSIRYRLSHKAGMIELLHKINGNIRNSVRVTQFKKLCTKFNITYLEPKPLTKKNAYISGFFDADGTICLSITKSSTANSIKSGVSGKIKRLIESCGYHKLEISITNKYFENVVIFQKAFGFGTIRKVRKKPYETYIYSIDLHNIPNFLDYCKIYPLRSSKKKRIFLTPKYFELKRIKAHLANKSTYRQKAWKTFCYKWYDYEFLID